MTKYKITECSNCGYKTKCRYVNYKGQDNKSFEGYLCDVCLHNYFAESAYLYPSLHLEDGDTIRMIAWGINYLRDKIKEKSE